MSLHGAIRASIRAYVDGPPTVDELHQLQRALASFGQPSLDAARAGDDAAERLLGLADALLAEYSMRHCTAAEFVAGLEDAIAQPEPINAAFELRPAGDRLAPGPVPRSEPIGALTTGGATLPSFA